MLLVLVEGEGAYSCPLERSTEGRVDGLASGNLTPRLLRKPLSEE